MILSILIIIIVLQSILSHSINNQYFYRVISLSLVISALLSVSTITISLTNMVVYNECFNVSNVTLFIQSLICIVAAMICNLWNGKLLSTTNMLPTIREHSLLVLFIMFGSVILISSNNLISLFISIELQSLSLYVMATMYRYNESSTAAGLKYLILGAFSSAIMLLGTALVYIDLGSFSYGTISILLHLDPITNLVNNTSTIFGITLIILGILFKLSSRTSS